MESRTPNLSPLSKMRAIPIVEVSLKHKEDLFFEDVKVDSMAIAAEVFEKYLGIPDREHFVLLALDNDNNPLHIETVAIGTLTGALVSPREVMKSVLLANAATIYVCHNHPSGSPIPSPDDIAVSHRLRDACNMFGIRFREHIILTRHGYTCIFAEGYA